MFSLEVFSNPLNGVLGEGTILRHEDFASTARYDEELVKPALLLADQVTLRSHRLDLLLGEKRDLEMTMKLAPLYSNFKRLSEGRDSRELTFLGLKPNDLLTAREIEHYQNVTNREDQDRERARREPMPTNVDALRAQRAKQREAMRRYDAEWEGFLERAQPFQSALRRRLAEAVEAFESESLNRLSSSELLSQVAWDPLPKSRPRQVIDDLVGDNTGFERAFNAMADRVASTTSGIMLDDAVNTMMAELPEPGTANSALTMSGAVNLMRMVEGVSALPLDEIPGVREELASYLQPFRGFVIGASQGIDWADVDDAERGRLLQMAWETDVQPAISEMEAHVRSAGFIRNAIDVFADGRDTFAAVGLAIGTVAASGFFGFSTLAATAAATPPLLKALLGSVRARETVKQNRAYFVHALGRSRAVRRANRQSRG